MESNESSFVHLTEFEMLTEQDVKSLVQLSSLKSCALDPNAFSNFGQPMYFSTFCTNKLDHFEMFTLSSRVRNYNTRPSFAGNFNKKKREKRRGLKFGTVSPRIWENSQSMLLKNKYINLLLLDLQRQDTYADIDTLINEIKKESS